MSLLALPSNRLEAWRWSDLTALPALAAAELAFVARVAGGQPALLDVQVASERTTRTALDVVEQRAALARISADLSFYLEECAS